MNKKEHGQTILEVLIALAVAVAIISSMTLVVTTSLRNADTGKTENLASQYAQEGMEIVRRLRDSDYQTFQSLSGTYCIAKSCSTVKTAAGDPCGSNATCSQNVGTFIRQVTMKQNDATCQNNTSATVAVQWTDGKCATGTYCHSVTLVSCFTNSTGISPP